MQIRGHLHGLVQMVDYLWKNDQYACGVGLLDPHAEKFLLRTLLSLVFSLKRARVGTWVGSDLGAYQDGRSDAFCVTAQS